MNLDEQTILVAGGNSGLGAACVRRFASRGAKVVIADVDESAVKQLGAGQDGTVAFEKTDVTDESSVRNLIEVAQSRFGPISAVVNCAGILGAARIVGRDGPHDLDLFTRVIQVNLIGTFNLLRLTADAMSSNDPNEQGERGVIITTSSVAAFEGQLGQAAYAASKGGVASMTLPAARELSKFGIRVVSIAPGVFLTPMMESAPAAVLKSLEQQIQFPARLGQPDEFAALAQHIMENPMINGSVIRLDGAMRMGAK